MSKDWKVKPRYQVKIILENLNMTDMKYTNTINYHSDKPKYAAFCISVHIIPISVLSILLIMIVPSHTSDLC
jgi:hypothetical protein